MKRIIRPMKVNFKCVDNDKFDLLQSSCVYHVSVGQIYHEGEKLLGTVELFNRILKQCTIVICDSLQRHTIDYELCNKELSYKVSLEKGKAWLKRNKDIINKFTIPIRVENWDYWLNHPDYIESRKIIDDLYLKNVDYKHAIHETIFMFIDRIKKRNDYDKFDIDKFFSLSLEYLLEECSIIIPLWKEQNYDFVIYPRKRTPAMEKTYEIFIKNNNEEIMRGVSLKFNRRSELSPLSYVADKEMQV